MLQNLALPAQQLQQPLVALQPLVAPQLLVTPILPAAPALPANEFSALTVKELTKQLLNLTKKQQLSGPKNYQ